MIVRVMGGRYQRLQQSWKDKPPSAAGKMWAAQRGQAVNGASQRNQADQKDQEPLQLPKLLQSLPLIKQTKPPEPPLMLPEEVRAPSPVMPKGKRGTGTGTAAVAPGGLSCPITGLLLNEPVVCCDGHTYERAAIVQWFAHRRIQGLALTSPLTNVVLETDVLLPNHALRTQCESFRSATESSGIQIVVPVSSQSVRLAGALQPTLTSHAIGWVPSPHPAR